MKFNHKDFLAQTGLRSLGFNPGTVDGLWGARSEQAFDAWLASRMPISAPVAAGGAFDSRTEANIARLTPKTQAAARKWMAEAVPAAAKHGMVVKITSGLRTYAEQDQLYAQGRSMPGPIVTNAKAGQSWHNFGRSWDFTLFKDGVPVWDSPVYRILAEIGKTQGLDCGAFWTKLVDEPHIQLAGLTMAQMRQMVADSVPIP